MPLSYTLSKRIRKKTEDFFLLFCKSEKKINLNKKKVSCEEKTLSSFFFFLLFSLFIFIVISQNGNTFVFTSALKIGANLKSYKKQTRKKKRIKAEQKE